MLAGDWADARAQFLHVALLGSRRWRQGSQPKNGGWLMPVPAVEAAAARGLSRTAWAWPVDNRFPLSFRCTHQPLRAAPPGARFRRNSCRYRGIALSVATTASRPTFPVTTNL